MQITHYKKNIPAFSMISLLILFIIIFYGLLTKAKLSTLKNIYKCVYMYKHVCMNVFFIFRQKTKPMHSAIGFRCVVRVSNHWLFLKLCF